MDIYPERIKRTAENLVQLRMRIKRIKAEADEIDRYILRMEQESARAVGRKAAGYLKDMEEEAGEIQALAEGLRTISALYEDCEDRILDSGRVTIVRAIFQTLDLVKIREFLNRMRIQ